MPGHSASRCKFSYLPGYAADWVWMRIAARTIRQLSSGSGLYELALDLRAEEPPDSGTTGTGDEPCDAQTASDTFDPLGGTGSTSNPSDGHVYYWRPGLVRPITVDATTGVVGSWHFPVFGRRCATDYAGDCAQNRVRCLVEGAGTMTIHTAAYEGVIATAAARSCTTTGTARARKATRRRASTSSTRSSSGAAGADFEFDISTHDGENCTHWVDVSDIGGACGAGWGFEGFDWVAS